MEADRNTSRRAALLTFGSEQMASGISVTYPAAEGSRFDLDYYRTKHVPLVRSRWGACGLADAKFMHGVAAPAGGPVAYHMTALLSFGSQEVFQRAAQQYGKEIMSDVKNFTDVKPIVQLNEMVE